MGGRKKKTGKFPFKEEGELQTNSQGRVVVL